MLCPCRQENALAKLEVKLRWAALSLLLKLLTSQEKCRLGIQSKLHCNVTVVAVTGRSDAKLYVCFLELQNLLPH